MRKTTSRRAFFFLSGLMLLSLIVSCLPKPPAETGDLNITVYGFSIVKEALENGIYPGFAAQWKQSHGQDVRFTSSYAGSETITNQILQGVNADIAILSIERDVMRLKQGGFVTADLRSHPQKSIVNKTPFIILVRKGNPKGVHDFADLAKPGVGVIHPDPVSSGGAQWSILAIYGSELVKSEKETGEPDLARSLRTLQAIWRNVKSTPGSAREARTQFETGFGDALITYELEGLLMKQSNKTPLDIVVPRSTIFSEHPAVVDAFMQYFWSDEAQQTFVKFHFHSATNETFDAANNAFGHIEFPFTIDYFGGWDKAYPEIIEGVFRGQVMKK